MPTERREGNKLLHPQTEHEAFAEVLENKSGPFPFNAVLVLPTSPFPAAPPPAHPWE